MTGPLSLRCHDLSFTYRHSDRPALDGVGLDIRPGRWAVLVGPAGAGKTTLARCLNRSIPHFFPGRLSGEIEIGGRPIASSRVAEMARWVGIVFQDFETQIVSTTCLHEVAFAMENRCVPRETILRRSRSLLERVGLAGFERRDPSTLSGGEKQRLVIASVLALEAPVLVLDEPASDLDSGGRGDLYRVIAEEQASGERRTVVLVEHDLEGIPRVDEGLVITEGTVARRWEGTPEGMAAVSAELRALGVRPPPLSELAARIGLDPAEADQGPAALDRALMREGWRLAPGEGMTSARPGVGGAELLRAEKLVLEYGSTEGASTALDGVDLVIREGEMVALIGANGSGKTTLAHLLAGLMAPTSGRALLRGEDVRGLPARRRALEIGFVFQNPDHQIFETTVLDEVSFGPRNFGLSPAEVATRAESALEVVGLSGLVRHDPFILTKGERQRLALASVLACEPSVIIMDEPTTGLDLNQQHGVMSLLERLNRRGHTILIITHALWMIGTPIERVLVMSRGRVIADGSPGEVLIDEGIMSRAGLRMPDLARLAGIRSVPLLSAEDWIRSLRPPAQGR